MNWSAGQDINGVRFGPLEIYVSCDDRRCAAQALVWTGEPETNAIEIMADAEANFTLPPGWSWRDGKTYCAKHV
jgi:hypothetical protein